MSILWNEEITLIAQSNSAHSIDENGFIPQQEKTKRTIFANKINVGYNEFFSASQAGQTVKYKVEVHTYEYEQERLVEYQGKEYFVLRTYEKNNGEITELTLAQRKVASDFG